MLQLSRHGASLEHSVYDTAMAPPASSVAATTVNAMAEYRAQAQVNPSGHGLGSPEGIGMKALLQGAFRAALGKAGMGQALRSRVAAVVVLAACILNQTPAVVGFACKTCIAAGLGGSRVGQRPVFRHQGVDARAVAGRSTQTRCSRRCRTASLRPRGLL